MLGKVQYIRGFVRIQVTGSFIERFINMAAYRGVYLWDVERTTQGVAFSISIKGFLRLKGCARKTGCRTKILAKNGIPFILHRYRKRKVLMCGIAFFVVALATLSSFVWRIEIEGTQHLTQDTIMVFLQEQGLHVGAPRFRLNDSQLQQQLVANFNEISWASVHTRGTRTTIRLTEALPAQEIINRQVPTHVVATSDGLITDVVAWSGAPMVRQGDIVRQGEMLVSGKLELVPDTPGSPIVYVHAQAEVWARRYHSIEFTVPLTYTYKHYTGQTTTSRVLQLLFFGNRSITIPWFNSSNMFESYDKITTYSQPGASTTYPLPIVMATTTYTQFQWQTATRTVQEAQELAGQIITNRIVREFDFEVDVIDKQISFTHNGDNVAVSAIIITNQRIDKQIPITVE